MKEYYVKDYFMELDFKTIPFKYMDHTEDYEPICEQIINDFNKNKKNEGSIIANSETIKYQVYDYEEENEKENMIKFIYKNKNHNIYANPKKFYFFFSKNVLFRVYSGKYLKKVKEILDKDYKIDKAEKGYNLYPKIYTLFSLLSKRMKVEQLICPCIIELKMQELDPFQIDENEGLKNEQLFTLIYNNKRKEFISEIENYVSSDKKGPMFFVGNDGIGKTISLQFYSFLISEDIKLYINFEIMNKIGFKRYFLYELMRCFLPFENTLENITKSFEEYINYVSILVQQKSFQENNLFECLQELEFEKDPQKIIYIFDQYQDQYQVQYLNKEFEAFSKIVYNSENKIIFCCSLNDKKIKEDIFINDEDENINMDDTLLFNTNDEQQKKNNEINKSKIDLDENEEEEKELINFKDLLEKKKKNLKEAKINMNKYRNNNIDTIQDNIFNNQDESSIDLHKTQRFKSESNYYDPILNLLKGEKTEVINQNKPVITKIYFNEIISIEPLIKELKDKELYKCMNNFNFFPKYYKRFLIFKKNYKNKGNIYDDFMKLQFNRIKSKLTKFFSKYDNENVYQSLISLKKIIIDAKEKPINYKTLYTYSKKFPFKYLSMKIEKNVDQYYKIYINKELFNKKFDINYSFPFIEYVVNKILEEYNINN